MPRKILFALPLSFLAKEGKEGEGRCCAWPRLEEAISILILYTGEGILDRSIGNKKLCGKIARERRKTKGGDDGGDGSSNPAWTLRRN